MSTRSIFSIPKCLSLLGRGFGFRSSITHRREEELTCASLVACRSFFVVSVTRSFDPHRPNETIARLFHHYNNSSITKNRSFICTSSLSVPLDSTSSLYVCGIHRRCCGRAAARCHGDPKELLLLFMMREKKSEVCHAMCNQAKSPSPQPFVSLSGAETLPSRFVLQDDHKQDRRTPFRPVSGQLWSQRRTIE